MPFYYLDSTMLVLIPAIIISAWAQSRISSTTNKYSKIKNSKDITGGEAARAILDKNGLVNVPIQVVAGNLTDNYNPSTKVLSLSDKIFNDKSITAIAVAAHECGHALQDEYEYMPLKIRSNIVPAVNFANKFSFIILMAGFIMSVEPLVHIGIVLFSATVIFQLVTLPVEFNASSRALVELETLGFANGDENLYCKKVLKAAAFTYVAATFAAIMQLLRLILLSNRRNNDR